MTGTVSTNQRVHIIRYLYKFVHPVILYTRQRKHIFHLHNNKAHIFSLHFLIYTVLRFAAATTAAIMDRVAPCHRPPDHR